ncbi:hypothetical protein RUE5091_02320 [Ruegeria denitrificans]|uniref:Uncharacterized protein n=1 Tax=Ruegeria denitrificans TaxID=1715692 RepID=A0A0P1IAL3_9RHOB|nr:hypothetical protein [Ruegeria denitrificans]CUK01997.1 hypothetical protein RUE5091_02320 [Ruegeria denitrificans]
MKTRINTFAALLALTALSAPALAETQLENALANGAHRLTAEEVSIRLADKTVTFENANTGAKALVYYDGSNGTKLKLEDGTLLDGFYAFDLADHVCVGVYGDAPMRLRCVHVVLIDGVMHKFELDGSLRGRIIEEVSGNII